MFTCQVRTYLATIITSVKEQTTNKKYKVVLNYHHGHKQHVGMCECGMWQEHYFPCKHAMMVIKKKMQQQQNESKPELINACQQLCVLITFFYIFIYIW